MTDIIQDGAVEPRRLVPSDREIEVGVDRLEYQFVPPDEQAAPRRSAKQVLGTWLRDADPRAIQGPKVPLYVLAVSGLIGRFDESAIPILLPDMRSEFGLNLQFLLTIGSLVGVLALLLAVPMGFIADRVKRVWMIRISAIAGAASAAAESMAPGVSQLVAGRAASGVAGSVGRPAAFPLLTDYFPAGSRARVFAFYGAVGALGSAVGPFVAGHLADAFGWRRCLFFMACLAGVVAVLTFFLREPTRGYWDRKEAGADEDVALTQQRPVTFAEGVRAAWSIVTLRRLCYASAFLAVGGVGINSVLSLYYAQVFQLSPSQRGNMATVGGVVGVVSLLVVGPIADRLLRARPGRVLTLVGLGVVVQCVGFFLLAISPNVWVSLVIEQPIHFVAAVVPVAVLIVTSLVIPARVRALGIQVAAPFQLVGLLAVPLVGGYIDSLGLRQGMLLFIPILVVGAVIVMGAALGVDRDMRAARAASMADEAARQARASGRNKMVICRDVDVEYDGVQVLFNVEFDVEEGEIIALLGTNGAGKSTLLRAIAGVQQASNGAIFLDGDDITHAPPHENAARGVVIMPGGSAVFPGLTVEENLRTAAWMSKEDAAGLDQRMAEVLAFFPALHTRMTQPAGNLSGGEQQMVGLSQAFLMKPRLLMIDELSLGLAPQVVEQLLDVLRAIHAAGTTIILVEQSLNVALTIAERAVFMEKGEVRFSGPTEELLERPDLVRSVFLGGAPGGLSKARPKSVQTEAREELLTVQGLGVAFGGVRALRDVSLDVANGEVVGLIGPNGAGKTTLFDAVSGVVHATEGRVLLQGIDVTATTPDVRARLGLGRSFQNARLFPSLTVRETVAVALEKRAAKNPVLAAGWARRIRRSEQRIYRRVDGLLELLGLGRFADKFVNELSTGTRRAVDLACIMAAEPKLVLLDEPSSGLAQAETEELGPVLLRVARETGCGMLLIEHDLPLITAVSDRLVALELGAVIAQGTPAEVIAHPRVLASYLAASEDVLARSGTRMAAIAAALTDAPTRKVD